MFRVARGVIIGIAKAAGTAEIIRTHYVLKPIIRCTVIACHFALLE